jgi:tetratricopeptide (TPR) repeat protein
MCGHPAGQRPWPSVPRRRCKVSLTMIVRDEQANLPRCLESAEGIFDEVILVDTGSADRTGEVARAHGARVSDFAWIEDFAAARNAALGHATGDYAFWLDADEVIDPAGREDLRSLLDALQPGAASTYTARFFGPAIPEPGIYQDRLFPCRPDVRWSCRIHEVVWPSIRRAGLSPRASAASVYHAGYADPAVHARKRARNERILAAWLAESPDDPFALWHAGRLAAARGHWAEALVWYRRSLAGWPADLMAEAPRAYIAQAEWELGHHRAAIRTCADSLALAPHHPPAWFAKGRMHLVVGDLDEAERCWRRVLTLAGGDPGLVPYCDPRFEAGRARRELAALAAARGDLEEAARWDREVPAHDPTDRDGPAAGPAS